MEDLRRHNRKLWDRAHATRGATLEGTSLRHIPNVAAIELHRLLPASSRVLEVGCANGRDARFLAQMGHEVVGIDFSPIALADMEKFAQEQGILDKIHAVEWDINVGSLPDFGTHSFDAFYARSALHVDDETMNRLAQDIDRYVKPGGIIIIEGKGLNDPKIRRSKRIGNVAIDEYEENHIRRVWTSESCQELCEQFGWTIEQLQEIQEEWNGTTATFTRLIARKAQ